MGDTTKLDKDSIKDAVDDVTKKANSASSGTKSSKKVSSDYNSVQGPSKSEAADSGTSKIDSEKKNYVKLDQSLFTGETVITLPSDNKLYRTDEKGKLITDENGEPIRASWNEEAMHKMQKSFVETSTSFLFDVTTNLGKYGFGYFFRTSAANITRGLANKFTSWLSGTKNVICDATFYDPTDPRALFLPPNVNHPGRYVVKNAKLSVLSFEPKYTGSTSELPKQPADKRWTESRLSVEDDVMYEFAEEPTVESDDYVTLGNLNLRFDFQSIRSAELWDDFLEHLANRNPGTTRIGMAGDVKNANPNSIMRLDLHIHKKGFGIIPYNPFVESPTFSLMVVLLPHENLRLDYDVARPFIARNYSFRIIKPREDNIRFEYNATSGQGKPWKFILSGHLKKSDSINVKTRMPYDDRNRLSNSIFFRDATTRVEFPIDKVAALASGEYGWEAKRLSLPGQFDTSANYPDNPTYLRGNELSDLIRSNFTTINDMLYNNKFNEQEREDRKTNGNSTTADVVSETQLPMLTLSKKIGEEIVETKNFFEFAEKNNSKFLGVEVLRNVSQNKTRANSLIRDAQVNVRENSVVLAVYFQSITISDRETIENGSKCWSGIS